jgi:transposase-like protein
MNKDTRIKQCEKMLHAGMANLFVSQNILNMDQFCVSVLEILMLLEREDYLKHAKNNSDIGNGTYNRTFKALKTNSLMVQIPRTRSGQFKPLTLELIQKQQEQVNSLALLLYRKGLSSRDV